MDRAEEFPTSERHHGYGNWVEYVALRYFNVYGSRMDAFGVYTRVMIRWIEHLANGQPCLVLGESYGEMEPCVCGRPGEGRT